MCNDLLADQRLSLALRTARQAKAGVTWKASGERVTDADVVLRSWILREVRSLFPEDGTIAEEAGDAWTSEREFVWIVGHGGCGEALTDVDDRGGDRAVVPEAAG